MSTITKLKLKLIEETLKDFKCLLFRYREVMNDKEFLNDFCKRNRNPLFDITTINYFRTGLKSKEFIENGGVPVYDHYIQRVKSTEIIFRELNNNPDMDINKFIGLIRKYASTIVLTKDEHKKVTTISKSKKTMNYLVYEEAGIEVDGLMELINN